MFTRKTSSFCSLNHHHLWQFAQHVSIFYKHSFPHEFQIFFSEVSHLAMDWFFREHLEETIEFPMSVPWTTPLKLEGISMNNFNGNPFFLGISRFFRAWKTRCFPWVFLHFPTFLPSFAPFFRLLGARRTQQLCPGATVRLIGLERFPQLEAVLFNHGWLVVNIWISLNIYS